MWGGANIQGNKQTPNTHESTRSKDKRQCPSNYSITNSLSSLQSGGSSSGAAILNYCPNEQNTYCCGDGNTTCCGTSFAHTLAGSATVTLSTVVSTAFVTYTPSATVGSSSHQPLSGAAREALSTGDKAGVGIGAGVGGLAIVAVASALVYRAKRRRQRQKQSSKMDEADGEGSNTTDEAAAAAAAAAGRRSSSSTDDPMSPTSKATELGGQALERRPNELDGEGARFEVPATAISTGGKREPGAIFELEGEPVSPVELAGESEVGSPRKSHAGSIRKSQTGSLRKSEAGSLRKKDAK